MSTVFICFLWTPYFRSLGPDGSQGQVQTRQVQITLGNGGALDLEIEDGGGFAWNIPLEYPWNQDLISTRVIAVYS